MITYVKIHFTLQIFALRTRLRNKLNLYAKVLLHIHCHSTQLAWICLSQNPTSFQSWIKNLDCAQRTSTTQNHIMSLTYLLHSSSSDSCYFVSMQQMSFVFWATSWSAPKPLPSVLTDPTIRLLTSISPKPRLRGTNQPPTSSTRSILLHFPLCSFFSSAHAWPLHASLFVVCLKLALSPRIVWLNSTADCVISSAFQMIWWRSSNYRPAIK